MMHNFVVGVNLLPCFSFLSMSFVSGGRALLHGRAIRLPSVVCGVKWI